MGLFDLGADWSEVEAPAFQNVPAGIYEATLTAIDIFEKDGKTSYTFDYLVTEDEGNDGKYVGRTVREFKRFTDDEGHLDIQALGYVKARLINLGVPEDFNMADLDVEDLLGTDVALTLKQNKEYTNVSRVEKIGGSVSSDPTDYDDDSAAAKIAAQKKAKANAVQSTDEDDDNPFA